MRMKPGTKKTVTATTSQSQTARHEVCNCTFAPEEATAFADLLCLLFLLCFFTSPVRPVDLQGRGDAGEDVLRDVPHHAGGEGARSFRLGPTRGQRTLVHPELEQADAEVLSSVETTRPLHMTSSFFGTLS